MRFFLLLLFVSGGGAQVLTPPLAGVARNRDNRLEQVYGLSGSLLPAVKIADGVLSSAFIGQRGLAKTSDKLLLIGPAGEIEREVDGPPGPAKFAFHPDGRTTLVFLSDSSTVYRLDPEGMLVPAWRQETADAIGFDADGRVRVLSSDSIQVLDPTTGALIQTSRVEGLSAPALFLPGGLLATLAGQLAFLADNGAVEPIAVDQVSGLERFAGNCVAIMTAEGRFLWSPENRLSQVPESLQ